MPPIVEHNYLLSWNLFFARLIIATFSEEASYVAVNREDYSGRVYISALFLRRILLELTRPHTLVLRRYHLLTRCTLGFTVFGGLFD